MQTSVAHMSEYLLYEEFTRPQKNFAKTGKEKLARGARFICFIHIFRLQLCTTICTSPRLHVYVSALFCQLISTNYKIIFSNFKSKRLSRQTNFNLTNDMRVYVCAQFSLNYPLLIIAYSITKNLLTKKMRSCLNNNFI
ncbi:unnamed protein product [Ceratitis capitata]|uniref:(Mediterranean fruit fly) hypothetical protein n=1 Tax=Ceratitis capitata TaxID=7213 RepID=A0A811V1K0_CERCA|nr:unnamed protein product [Ceratitis capitata]